jgi:hypothetical protein
MIQVFNMISIVILCVIGKFLWGNQFLRSPSYLVLYRKNICIFRECEHDFNMSCNKLCSLIKFLKGFWDFSYKKKLLIFLHTRSMEKKYKHIRKCGVLHCTLIYLSSLCICVSIYNSIKVSLCPSCVAWKITH